MLVKSTLLAEARGSLNGATFSRTKAGMIVRSRTVPVQPNTAFQTLQRSRMQMATDAFRSLTNAELAEWQDAISLSGFTTQNALGDTYTPSAKQVFTMCSLNLIGLGISGPPDVSKFLANSNLPGIQIGSVSIAVTGAAPGVLADLSLVNIVVSMDSTVEVMATLPISPTIRNYKKYLRRLPFDAGLPANTPSTENISGAYVARYSGLDYIDLEGNVINLAVRAVNQGTGLAGAWLYIGGQDVPVATP